MSYTHTLKDFDPLSSKSRNFYAFLIQEKAFALETFAQCFQFKILNILFLNTRLAKIERIQSVLCTFCQTSRETLKHFFYRCSFSTEFWTKFKNFWLTVINQRANKTGIY